jgi:hypothetical protein
VAGAIPARAGELDPDFHAYPSRNVAWVRALFTPRLARAWSAKLAYAHDPAWEATREGQAMYKLVCATGWIPRLQCVSLADVEAMATLGGREVERWSGDRIRRIDGRNHARRRVYNMMYPKSSRGWGPFLPYSEEPPTMVDEEDMDSNDGEWCIGGEGDEHGGEPREQDAVVASERNATTRESSAFRIPSHLLVPDWAFLASVRIVVEANMRENGWEGLNGVSELDALRIGRWPAEREGQELDGKRIGDEGEKVTMPSRSMGRKPTAETVEGWDWAGVEGIWRQVVLSPNFR